MKIKMTINEKAISWDILKRSLTSHILKDELQNSLSKSFLEVINLVEDIIKKERNDGKTNQ